MSHIKKRICFILLLAVFAACSKEEEKKNFVLETFPVETTFGKDFAPRDQPNMAFLSDSVGYICCACLGRDSLWTNSSFFKTEDRGKNWSREPLSIIEGICTPLISRGDTLFAGVNQAKGNTSSIMMSTDGARTWETIANFNVKIVHFKIFDGGVFGVMIYDRAYAERFGEKEKEEASRQIYLSKDSGKSWNRLFIANKHPHDDDVAFSEKHITYNCFIKRREHILQVSIPDLQVDTLYKEDVMITQLRRYDNLIAVWENNWANFYRVTDGHARFMSNIHFTRSILTNHIPDELYKYGNVVYTLVYTLRYKTERRCCISTDGGRNWQFASNEWYPNGYKDRMMKYCRTEDRETGDVRDTIKIIRPVY